MVTQNTFPQSGDEAHAEDWAALSGQANLADYVEQGMEFTNIDYTNLTADVTTGKAFILMPDATKGSGETVLRALFAIHIPQTTVSLTDSAVNYVYLNGNVGTNDSPQLNVYTDQTTAGSNELLLGTIDTSNNVSELRNRNPDIRVDHLRSYADLGIPVYDEVSNAETGKGNIIYTTGDGSSTKGLWFYTTSGWEYSGIQNLRDSDVSGITGLIEDTSGNRPAAGTEGRLFFQTDTQEVFYDDGSSWIRLALDASQIGAGDLGFDPATQSELDSHAGTGDAHHTKTTALNELNDTDITENIVDLESNLPTAGNSGRFFVARDTGKTLYDDGSSWVNVGVSSHDELDTISSDDHHIRPVPGTNISEDGSNNFNVVQGSGSGLDADLLDGVELGNITWGDVSMDQSDVTWSNSSLAQSDINVSDLGAADTSLDMGGYNVTNTGGVVLPVGTDQWV